jgi:hypothetical protein
MTPLSITPRRNLFAIDRNLLPDLIARFHSWNHLFMSDVAKACSRSAKKHTAWRSCYAQKQSDRCDCQPKLTKFSIIALLFLYQHLHRKYKIYYSKTRCKTARKTIEYLQNAIPVSWAQFGEFQRRRHTVKFPRGWKRTQSWSIRKTMKKDRWMVSGQETVFRWFPVP